MTSIETARQQLDPNLQVDGFAVSLRDQAGSRQAMDRYRPAGLTSAEIFDHQADGVGAVRAVLTSLGAMLLLVGLVSVANTVSAGIRERRRDLGILKALGFTPRQLVASVLTGATVLAAIALAVGIPLGLWVTTWISDFMGNQLGWGPGLFQDPPLLWLAAVAPIVVFAVLCAAAVPAAAAARLRPNESLRAD
jgi:putative ABC transport system permease protein